MQERPETRAVALPVDAEEFIECCFVISLIVGAEVLSDDLRSLGLVAASVSGLYFSHPDAKYFNVGRINRDQLEDYARHKGESLEVTERWPASQLAYEPAEFGVKC